MIKTVELKHGHVPWMILATVAFSIMALLVKELAHHLAGFQIVIYRSLSHLVVLAPLVYFQRVPIFKELSRAVLLRSLLAFFGVTLYFISLSKLDAGLASLLQWSAPAFTFLYGVTVLREKLSARSVLCLLLAISGVVVAFGLRSHGLRELCPTCIAIGLAGALCAGFSYGVLKTTARKASPETLATWMSLVSLAGALIGSQGHVEWVHGMDLWSVVGIGVMVSFYQFAVAKAYQAAPAIRVAPFSVAPAITVMLMESALQHRVPESHQLVGSAITVGALVLLAGTSSS